MNLLRALFEKPWLAAPQDADGLVRGTGLSAVPPQRVALMFFLVVVGIVFGLFITAYFIRMELDDWRPMPEHGLLWFNTLLLFLGSAALQWTAVMLRRGFESKVRTGLLLGSLFTLAFVYGQYAVWGQMSAQGYYLYNNPANAFFYVLTGIHALHILGGLFVWFRAGFRLLTGASTGDIRLSVELCAVYWHFLLLVWLVLFALLSYT